MFKSTKKPVNIWMSFADLLTGALVVFMLITVVMVIKVNGPTMIVEEEMVKMDSAFQAVINNIEGVELVDRGTLRFTSPYVGEDLFNSGSDTLTDSFKSILDEVFPAFLNQVKLVSEKNSKVQVKEIRLEGHTDSRSSYDINLTLSQNRAKNTWFYLRETFLTKEEVEIQELVRDKIVTVGFGKNKLLDKDGKLVNQTRMPEDKDRSRRVELSLFLESKGDKK